MEVKRTVVVGRARVANASEVGVRVREAAARVMDSRVEMSRVKVKRVEVEVKVAL